MLSDELDIYIELYKRKQYQHIPLGAYPGGEYFYPTEKQISTLNYLSDDITSHIGYGGSARSGKTIIETTAIIFDCLAYPDIAWGLARRELTVLKRTALLTLFKQLAFYGLKSVKGKKPDSYEYNYNQQANYIIFSNKSQIFFIDSAYRPSDPLNTRFGGLELTRCAIDESNETNISVVHKLFERTGWRNNDTYKIKAKLFECFNPDKNHVHRRYWTPFKKNQEPEHSKFIRALPSDNPNPLVQEWINNVKRTGDRGTIERQINGNFDYDDNPDALLSYDTIHAIWTNTHIAETRDKYIVCDAARLGSDIARIAVFYGGVVKETLSFDKSLTTEIQSSIIALSHKHGIPKHSIIVDEDGVGGGIVDNVGCIGFKNGSKAKDEIYKNLKTQCAYKLAEYMRAEGIYFQADISESDKELVEVELGQLITWKIDEEGKLRVKPKSEIKDSIGHSPDWLDVFIMRMYFELMRDNLFTEEKLSFYDNVMSFEKCYGFISIDSNRKEKISIVVGVKDNRLYLSDCVFSIDDGWINEQEVIEFVVQVGKEDAILLNRLRAKHKGKSFHGIKAATDADARIIASSHYIKNRLSINKNLAEFVSGLCLYSDTIHSQEANVLSLCFNFLVRNRTITP